MMNLMRINDTEIRIIMHVPSNETTTLVHEPLTLQPLYVEYEEIVYKVLGGVTE